MGTRRIPLGLISVQLKSLFVTVICLMMGRA
uniref:Uncharacterized protein n=1 Tax=Arundo donax TaxID=35708 RepID=A0A0A9GT31_ARUDO